VRSVARLPNRRSNAIRSAVLPVPLVPISTVRSSRSITVGDAPKQRKLRFLIAGAGFAAAGIMQRPFGAVLCLTLANFGMDLAVPVAWAGCLEAGGKFGGTATAFMNTGATISAFISPLAAAWMFTMFGSFQAMLMSAGAVYLIASLLWLKVDPRRAFDSLVADASVSHSRII
jgi:hypothetical protein